MANIKSAKKRISTNDRQKGENKFVKATISTYVKEFRKLVEAGNVVEAEKQLQKTISYIDSACSKGIIHRNTASRKVSRLQSALYKAQGTVKVEEVKPVKKTVAKVEKVEEVKEEAPKKTVAKKTTTKKATAEEKPAKKTTRKTTKKEA